MRRPSLFLKSAVVLVLFISGYREGLAEGTSDDLDSPKKFERAVEGFRTQVGKIQGLDPKTAEKILGAFERLVKKLAVTAESVRSAATKFDESDTLDFSTLKGQRNKLPALKRWKLITQTYEAEAVAGQKLIRELPTIFKSELVGKRLPEKEVAVLMSGFLKADKMEQARRAYDLQAKVAGGANRFVKLLIDNESVWEVDPDTGSVA